MTAVAVMILAGIVVPAECSELMEGTGTMSVARAQSASPGAFCAVLTLEEVQAASGAPEPLLPTEFTDDANCEWSVQLETGEFFMLTANYRSEQLADLVGIEGTIDTTVAGQPALFFPIGVIQADLPGGGSLAIQWIAGQPESGDVQAILTGLAELALPRAAGMALETDAVPPSMAAGPADAGDPELVALFPSEVGGVPVEPFSISGRDADFSADPALVQLLEAQGRTIDDVSLALWGDATLGAGIQAIRVEGADILGLADGLLALSAPGAAPPTAGQVAGKEVMLVTTVDGMTQHAYAKDDVLWIVVAEEPALTEIFQQLP